MPQATLTVRIQALDGVTPVINKIKGAARNIGIGSTQLSRTGVGPAILGGMAGGAVAGGVMALGNMLQDIAGKIMNIAHKIYNALSESSGLLKMVNKLWERAIMEILRPIGDMLAAALMPGIIELTQITRSNYAEFIKNVQEGMSVNDALKIATDKNVVALANFLGGLEPVLKSALDALKPLIKTTIEELTPVITDAFISIAPMIGGSIYKGIMEQVGMAIFGVPPTSAPVPAYMQSPGQQARAIQGGDWSGVAQGDVGLKWIQEKGGWPFNQFNFYGNVYGKEDMESAVNSAMNKQMVQLQGVV